MSVKKCSYGQVQNETEIDTLSAIENCLLKGLTNIIKYDSYSHDLSHIADRRRAAIWIDKIDFSCEDGNVRNQDVVVVTPMSKLRKYIEPKSSVKVVLDMVDGYLVEDTSAFKDYARQLDRVGVLEFFKNPSRFSKSIARLCKACDLVTVGSEEQASTVRALNPNVFPIWDCHDEFGSPREPLCKEKVSNFNIFWEGLSVTLFHFEECMSELREFILKTDSTLHIVTNSEHYRFGNKFFKIPTEQLIAEIFKGLESRVIFHPWSIPKVREVASECDFGLIPLLEGDKFARLKPENKLMIYWRFGLPTLFSDSPSYLRVSKELGLSDFSVAKGKWGEKLSWLANDLVGQGGRISSATEMLRENHNEKAILAKWQKAFQTLAP